MKFHPSSLGLIMADAQSVDRSLVPADLLAICDKPRKTDADREALAPVKEASLSAGAKTYLNGLAKQEVYGYRKDLDVKYLDKGIICEGAAIQMLNDLRFKSYAKNTERRESEFLTGECDIYVPGVKTIDTKVSWSLDTFPAVSEDAHDTLYEWQGRAYMVLWDVPEHEVVFLMLDTPEHLIRWEQPELHRVAHIPLELRCTSITYQRDAALEAKMHAKCATAMRYLLRRIDQIHTERVPKPIIIIGTEMTTTEPALTPAAAAVQEAKQRAVATENVRHMEAQQASINEARAKLEADQRAAEELAAVKAMPGGAENFTRAHTPPALRLGQISDRLGFNVTADFLMSIGFAPAAQDRAAKLYHEADFPLICAALVRHITAVQQAHAST